MSNHTFAFATVSYCDNIMHNFVIFLTQSPHNHVQYLVRRFRTVRTMYNRCGRANSSCCVRACSGPTHLAHMISYDLQMSHVKLPWWVSGRAPRTFPGPRLCHGQTPRTFLGPRFQARPWHSLGPLQVLGALPLTHHGHSA